ncbi:Alginate lyase [compost metagenome]
MIDFSELNLTTPEVAANGGAMLYLPGNYPENEYFQTLDNTDVQIWAPTKGASTKSTSRTRTEFRECRGKYVYNWAVGDFGHHWLRVAMTVTQQPRKGETTIGQIHVSDNTRPLLKLIWKKGNIVASFRQVFDQPNPVDTVIVAGVPLNTRFRYTVHVTRAGSLSINVAFTDAAQQEITGKFTAKLDASWYPRFLYLKAGVYNQEDPTETTSPEEGSKAVFHALAIEHTD